MSDSLKKTGRTSGTNTRNTGADYRTPISFYVMMGGIVFGLLLALVGLFFI